VSVDRENVCEVGHYETGWRQEQHQAWLWTAVTAELTVFSIDRSRGGAAIEALLGSTFAGVVGSDRWSAYRRFPAERRALCYAHLKRDFQALVDQGGEAGRLAVGGWPKSSASLRRGTASEPGSSTARSYAAG
jgi:transposase